MNPNNYLHKFKNMSLTVASYLAIISVLFAFLYQRFDRWKLFIDQHTKLSTLIIIASAASLFLLYAHRGWIISFFKNEVVRYGILFLAVAFAVFSGFHIPELFVFIYAIYAILFIENTLSTRKVSIRFVDALFDVESRTPAIVALLLLVSLPLFLLFNKTAIAESTAIYVYYFLVITVVLQILELKRGIRKENPFLPLFAGAWRSFAQAITVKEKRTKYYNSALQLVNRVFTIRNAAHALVLATMLAGLYAAKNSHWKKVMQTVNNSPEYRSELSLINKENNITFPAYDDEITVPVNVKHPLNNPLRWPISGVDAVTIGIRWFSLSNDAQVREKVFEDYQPLPRMLYLNEVAGVQVKLKRPDVPYNRKYEVRIGLVAGANKWFADSGDGVLKLRVQMERPSGGDRAFALEQKNKDLLRNAVEEELSDRIWASQGGYRSKLELLPYTVLTPRSMSVVNTSMFSWPIHNQHPIKVGVAWIQKIVENGSTRYVHAYDATYPLPGVMHPGAKATIDISMDPRNALDADEIWIGMVHDGKTWFYDQGDAVIKLPNNDKRPDQQLAGLQRKNDQLEKELTLLRGKRVGSSLKADSTSRVNDADFRSKIRLLNDESKDRLMTNANRLLLDLEITNTGQIAWNPSSNPPVNLGVFWFKKADKVAFTSPRIAEGRCIFPFSVLPKVALRMQCFIGDNVLRGDYEVWIGPVQEGVAWFYEKGDSVLKLNVTVQ